MKSLSALVSGSEKGYLPQFQYHLLGSFGGILSAGILNLPNNLPSL
jgi:hypothetical protein